MYGAKGLPQVVDHCLFVLCETGNLCLEPLKAASTAMCIVYIVHIVTVMYFVVVYFVCLVHTDVHCVVSASVYCMPSSHCDNGVVCGGSVCCIPSSHYDNDVVCGSVFCMPSSHCDSGVVYTYSVFCIHS